MKRKGLMPLLAVVSIGTLVAGIVACAIAALVAVRQIGHPLAQLQPPPRTSRATATPATLTPAGRSASAVTRTPSSVARSPTPFPTGTPPGTTSPPSVIPTPTHMPTGTPESVNSSPIGTPEPPTETPVGPPRPPTATPTDTPEPAGPDAAPTATPSTTPVVAAPGGPAQVTGRLLKDGGPVQAGTTVNLEDEDYAIVATSITDAQGVYVFDDLTAFGTELSVLFAQEWNEQYEMGEVASWVWLGPVTISRDATVHMPDLEISLLGCEPVDPPSGASLSAGEISAQNPLVFEWTAYPQVSAYWVDLSQGDDLVSVWQSGLADTTSVAFDGTLGDGSHVTADTYWWGVGALRDVGGGDYQLTVYGYLPTLELTP